MKKGDRAGIDFGDLPRRAVMELKTSLFGPCLTTEP